MNKENDPDQVIDHGEGLYEISGQITCPNPRCKQVLSGAGNWPGGEHRGQPTHGDVTICAYCETIARYDKADGPFRLVKLSKKEVRALDPETKEAFDQIRHRLAMAFGPLGSRAHLPRRH